MTEKKDAARPSQVTMAGALAVVGSFLLIMSLFESMGDLRSVQMRDSIEEFLSTPPGNGLGLTVESAVEIIRGLLLATGAAAAVTLVLGVYVLKRSRGARLGLTIAAAVIALTAPVSGGFLPVLLAFAALLLWTGPAREWFAGASKSSDQQRSDPHAFRGGSAMSSHESPPFGDNSQEQPQDRSPNQAQNLHGDNGSGSESQQSHPSPGPTRGFGTPPSQQGQEQHSSGPQGGGAYAASQGGASAQGSDPEQPNQSWAPPQNYGQQAHQSGGYPQQYQPAGGYPGGYPGSGAADPDKRPTTVTVAAWLTWVFAGLTLLAYIAVALTLLAARDQLLDQLRQDPRVQDLDVATNDIISALWLITAVFILWCLSAIVLAVLAYRRVNWARIMLAVSAGVTALLSLGLIMSGVSAVYLLGAGAVMVLLFTGGANEWFSSRGKFRGHPPQQGGSYGGPPQQGGSYGGPPQQGGPYYGGPQQNQPPNQPPGNEQQDSPKNVW